MHESLLVEQKIVNIKTNIMSKSCSSWEIIDWPLEISSTESLMLVVIWRVGTCKNDNVQHFSDFKRTTEIERQRAVYQQLVVKFYFAANSGVEFVKWQYKQLKFSAQVWDITNLYVK